MTNLLYICYANINRSPAAEIITKRKTKGTNLHVSSAGLIDPPYCGMAPEMIDSLTRAGYEFNTHQPKKATLDLLKSQDIILCMEKLLIEQALGTTEGLEGKVYTLPEFAGFPDEEIISPDKLIKNSKISRILKYMPSGFSEFIYQHMKYINPRDREGVIRVHMNIIKRIENYVDIAIKRIFLKDLKDMQIRF